MPRCVPQPGAVTSHHPVTTSGEGISYQAPPSGLPQPEGQPGDSDTSGNEATASGMPGRCKNKIKRGRLEGIIAILSIRKKKQKEHLFHLHMAPHPSSFSSLHTVASIICYKYDTEGVAGPAWSAGFLWVPSRSGLPVGHSSPGPPRRA